MALLNLEQLLAEMETEDYSYVPPNCTSGEEYEEWLRKEVSQNINWHSELIQRILKNDILSSVIINDKYELNSTFLSFQSSNWQKIDPYINESKILYKRGHNSFSINQKGCLDYGQAS
jgi:hypothetical protein